jgi:hypothetical protein
MDFSIVSRPYDENIDNTSKEFGVMMCYSGKLSPFKVLVSIFYKGIELVSVHVWRKN